MLLVILLAPSAAVQEQADPQRGREVFEQNCAMCHGSDASGMMGMHPSLRGAIERLSRDGVEVTIRNGRDVMPPMPAFEGRLSDEDISDVIAYLETLPAGPRNFDPGDGMMDGMGDMMGGSGMGSNWVPWLLVGVLTIALIGMVIALIARSRAGGRGRRSRALDILEERYARVISTMKSSRSAAERSRPRHVVLRRASRAALAAVALVIVSVSPAWAHAELVQASPAPGSGLPQAPGAVVVRFNEPLNRRLSGIEILDPSGRDVDEGATLPVKGDPQAMKRRLGLLSPGVYTVQWTTVSTVDGHTLHGSYRFGIGTSASADESVRASPIDSEGWLGLVGRFVALVGLTLWGGSAFLSDVAARAKVPRLRSELLTRLLPWLAFVGATTAVVSSSLVSSGSIAGVTDVLLGGSSGRWRTVLLSASLLGGILGPSRARTQRLLVAVALVSEAASGHAASSPAPLVATISFSVHLLAVGTWGFAIVASMLSSERLRTALATFTPYAVGAAIAVALTGMANATLELSAPGDLLSTGYGRTLLLKTAAFVVIAGLGLSHYVLRRVPRPSATRLKLPLRAEAAAIAVAVGLATVLVGFPNPPRESEAAGHQEDASSIIQFVRRDAVSVAQGSGPFVIGLSLTPARPGPVDFRVDVLGVEPGDALREAEVRGRSDSGSEIQVPLSPCGLGCFQGDGIIDAAGEWRMSLAIVSNRGRVELEAAIPLPTPDGSEELERAVIAMEELRSARMRQDLSGRVGGPMIVSRYLFEAPDKMDIRVEDSRRIIIGDTEYRKGGDGGRWGKSDWPGSPFTWPENYYRSFWREATAARVLGTEKVRGERYRIVSFLRPDLPAWFRLWVRISDGVVVRQEMRAEGHIMDDIYSRFNAPLAVRPPP
jgi:copper transport protein